MRRIQSASMGRASAARNQESAGCGPATDANPRSVVAHGLRNSRRENGELVFKVEFVRLHPKIQCRRRRR